MNQLILVFEENLEIQNVIASSLKDSDISIVNESNPDLFLKQLKDSDPDLIFISNSDSNLEYKICREIRNDISLDKIPIILLLNAKDNVEDSLLSELRINSILRKPFEASMLKKQLSQFIDLDENFGNGPHEDDEDFKIDMTEIGSQLQEIKHAKSNTDRSLEEAKPNKGIEKNELNPELTNLEAVKMDSILLENVTHSEVPRLVENDDEIDIEKNGLIDDVKLEARKEKKIEYDAEEKDNEIEMENGFEFDLKLEEDQAEEIPNTSSIEKKASSDGLEKLKNSGLEDQFAESRLFDQKEETIKKSRIELNDIDLKVNDFEEQKETWDRPDELDLYHQTPREGLADINLDESDFQPEFPKNLSSFGNTEGLSLKNTDEISKGDYEISDGMDNVELEADSGLYTEVENQQDNVLLIDSESQDEQKMEESEEFEKIEVDSSSEAERTDDSGGDTEIKSMVQDSFNVQEEVEEIGLDELEELNSQMAELESEEAELEAEEIEFESEEGELESEEGELKAEEIEFESEEGELESEEGELESEEGELEAEEIGFESEEGELEDKETELENEDEGLGEEEIGFEDEGQNEILETSEKLDLDEDVFKSWDDAESAFMSFDRESKLHERISSDLGDGHENGEKTESYSFTEEELKEIVSSSVQKALEKSIASSLVELAVSELKTTVSEMDQDWL